MYAELIDQGELSPIHACGTCARLEHGADARWKSARDGDSYGESDGATGAA